MNVSAPKPTLPPGETDPNRLYIAVGRAIHAWESMESALARLYAALAGLPERPDALADYGAENRRFIDRVVALNEAAEKYSVNFPDQHCEGEMFAILERAKELSIKRHRIAHGHITMWTEIHIPENCAEEFEVEGVILYRWGAPWFATLTLRTDPVGTDAASIAAVQKEFEDLHNRIAAFTAGLPKSP